MDDEASYREQRHRRREREQRHKTHQGWKFTFLGGTSEQRSEAGSRARFAPGLTQHALSSQPLVPLSTAQVGDRVVISQILGGESLMHRLNNRGLTLGSEVRVISKTRSGSVIICIQDEQIGLGAGMANQVMVTFAAETS